MAKLAISGAIDIAPGSLDAFLPMLMAHRARCLGDEPGTRAFEVIVPDDDKSKVLLFEVYDDRAAFDVHWDGPSLARLRSEAGAMIQRIYGTFGTLAE
jgi:quinol monooxygenase YgiN